MRTPHFQLLSIAIIGTSSCARAQTITTVQPGPGYQHSAVTYIAPGGVLVGYSTNAFQGVSIARPTRWATIGSQAELLGVDPVGGGGVPWRCSDDGQVVVGQWNSPGLNTPAMWSSTGTYSSLPGPGSVSIANGVSADGSIVTGWSTTSAGRWMLRWTNGVLTQQFGTPTPFVSGPCSPDASMAFGIQYFGGSAAALARWTLAGGPNGSIQTIMNFPATWTNIREVVAMNPSGSAAMGLAYTGNNAYQGWIWRNGQITDMGLPAGISSIEPRGFSADATIAVGAGFIFGQPLTVQRAEVWTSQTGWLYMGDWLGSQGISFPGWTFSTLNYISPDGRTLAGQGVSPLGDLRGFVVTIPAPGSAAVVLFVAGVVRRRKRGGAFVGEA